MSCLVTNCYPALTLIRLANRIEHELNSITVFKTCGVFNNRPACAHRLTNSDCQRGKTARPTTFTHALGHVVLLYFNRTPHTGAGWRTPQFAGLFNHERALRAVDLHPVLILS